MPHGAYFEINMDFDIKKRQQFLTEANFHTTRELTLRVIQRQKENFNKPEGSDVGWHLSMWFGITEGTFNNFILSYISRTDSILWYMSKLTFNKMCNVQDSVHSAYTL